MRKKKMHRIPVYKVRIKMANIIKKNKKEIQKEKASGRTCKDGTEPAAQNTGRGISGRLSKHRNATMRRAV